MKKRTVALLMAAVLLFGAAVGGTLALLTAKTDTITNTFTAGKVAITLTETKPSAGERNSIKMVPGTTIDKDPTITVLEDSEACWLFVKIVETNTATYLDYDVAAGWTALGGQTGVYYREVAAVNTDTAFKVLDGDVVTVLDTVTSSQMEAANNQTVSLSFTGYAVQKDTSIADAAAAWDQVKNL